MSNFLDTRAGYLAFFLLGFLILTTTAAWSLSALNEQEMSDISAQQGLLFDFNVNLIIKSITYTDGDGNGTGSTGIIRLGAGATTVTVDRTGSAVDLLGLSVDADGDIGLGTTATTGGAGGIVVGMPTGQFDVSLGDVAVGSTSTPSTMFNVDVTGIDVSNTTIEIGAN